MITSRATLSSNITGRRGARHFGPFSSVFPGLWVINMRGERDHHQAMEPFAPAGAREPG